MRSKHWLRIAPLILALALSLVALPAQARTTHHQTKQQFTHTIDWAHPFRVHFPGPGMPHSGIGSPTTGDIMPNSDITPNANFPSGCYNNYAYNVIVNGQTVWTTSYSHLEAWVEYQWCPKYSGDTVGINWSYGRDYITGTGYCETVEVGENEGPGVFYRGAFLASATTTYDDGESPTDYTICSGHYAWDYSQTAIGSGLYCAVMIGYIPSSNTFGQGSLYAGSPCYH